MAKKQQPDATQTVAELKAENARKASAEINAILTRYECVMFPTHLQTPNGDQWDVQIVSK